ncbi:hypothetical protein BC834DRAFT_167967 [Gloeopeniophorella convolvens]|nr:hypothetical protein BC834DRAFT_167967 [Gloeopeniophorella convolvens]
MDLQTDLRRTLEEGQGDGDGDGEPEDEDGDDEDGDDDYVEERAAPPAVYPREAAPRAHGPEPELDDDALPALPPDTDDEADDGAEDDPAQAQAQAHEPRRTVAGSERRPGGGINWWRMYRFPPMVVPPGAVPAPASPTAAAATPTAVAAAPEPSPGAEHGAAPAQDGSTVVPVIVVGLQSVRRARGEAHGSTTFFIYVIGGYYPPNHQLVIGTDPLASFDELAELLGHAKPPTATKEDIEQSGLEVIRAAVLAEYERAGRVAPMCVDRCLICLDEYGAEEDLRLLGCRHVFHKECVDRWLETGRNNCPACRSQVRRRRVVWRMWLCVLTRDRVQGVSTGAGPLSIPSSA